MLTLARLSLSILVPLPPSVHPHLSRQGAEIDIVPKLLASNASRLVDVFLWECHAKWRGIKGKCQCANWEEALRRSGVRQVYHEPYRFTVAEKLRAAKWNATLAGVAVGQVL